MQEENIYETEDSLNFEADTELLSVETQDEQEIEQPEVDVQKVLETNKRLFARAKEAEAKLKQFQSAPKVENKAPSQINNNTANSNLDIEKTVLLATGMDSELLIQLEKVAKVEGTSLIEAQKSDLFISIKSQIEAKSKSEKASLGASRGSARTPVKKSFDTPGLTADEHKQMVQDLLNS